MTSKNPKVCLYRELDFSFTIVILVILKVDIIKNSFVLQMYSSFFRKKAGNHTISEVLGHVQLGQSYFTYLFCISCGDEDERERFSQQTKRSQAMKKISRKGIYLFYKLFSWRLNWEGQFSFIFHRIWTSDHPFTSTCQRKDYMGQKHRVERFRNLSDLRGNKVQGNFGVLEKRGQREIVP